MALLIDLFGYLSIVLHGLTIGAQSMAVGGVLFLVALARPFAATLPDGAFGLVEYVARTAATLGDALRALSTHVALNHERLRCPVVEDRGRMTLRQELASPPEAYSPHTTELMFALVVRAGRALTGTAWRPAAVRFRHEACGDDAAYAAAFAGAPVALTPTEYELLRLLARNAGKLLTHPTILREIWGPAYSEESNYLHVYVSQLRRKLEPDPTRPRYLLTQPGVGYRLVASEDAAAFMPS